MRVPRPRLILAALLLGAAAPASAQRPSAAEAQALLESRPDLAAQVRQKIGDSRLTPDQIRARLRAAGYPEHLLDQYMPGTIAGDSAGVPGADVFAAVRALGIASEAELSAIAAQAELRELPADTTTDAGVPIFGLSLFRNGTSQFTPNLSGPVDANYRLGPGDQLVLILTGDVELAHTLEVTREGFIVIPQVGQLFVANLTLGQLEDVLYGRLGRVYSGVRRSGATTRFSISVARLRANQVFVIGDVAVPGSYQVSSAGTALTALYAAGGPSSNGSMRQVEIRRGGKLVSVLDVYDYLLRGDASRDIRLETGDIVFVPVHGARVQITGEIIRPASYELKPGETLRDLVAAAGGFTESASRRRVQLVRILPPAQRQPGGRDRIVIDLPESQFTGAEVPPFPLEAGDQVRVFPVAERVWGSVAVQGHVWAPGPQGYTNGMRVSDAIRLAGGVKPDVYLGQVLVSRLEQDSSRVMLRTALVDTTGAVTDDFVLREDDEIRLFSVTEFRPERWVTVSGAVRNGGRIPFHDGMTMRDAVLLAGGLQEFAYLKEAEIARLPGERTNGTVAWTMRVPLDSTYLFDRGPDGEYLGPPGIPTSSNGAPEVELRPYDNVLILRQPDWELQRLVAIQGQVRFPGRYSLTSKTERLSELIRRAGGLTSEAYADGVVFYRKEGRTGRVGIDLPSVLEGKNREDDLILQDGDSIFVPEYNPVVLVTGAVNSPVGVAYVEGASIEYYIGAAGGASRDADVKRAYVRQPNGVVEAAKYRPLMLPNSLPDPRAGAVVVVPERHPEDRKDYAAIAGSLAQVLASIVAVIALATR